MEPALKTSSSTEKRFDWPVCYDAENYVLETLESVFERNTFARSLSEQMRRETGTLFLDWVDHLAISRQAEPRLRELGFVPETVEAPPGQRVFWHPEALLPRIVINPSDEIVVALRVESIDAFKAAHRLSESPEGPVDSPFRRLLVDRNNGACLEAIERRGYRGYVPQASFDPGPMRKARAIWKRRPRTFENEEEGFKQTLGLLDDLIGSLGRDLACAIVFEEERAFWQSRNRAGQVQKKPAG